MPYNKMLIATLKCETIAFKALINALNVQMSEAQRLIDKRRVFCNGTLVESKNQILSGKLEIISYQNAARGEKPVFETEDFAVFDKQSGVLSHPNGRKCEYSLCDEAWTLYGKQAGVAHRLDRETSGLILIAKNKAAQRDLKALFESKMVQKEYLALVYGLVESEFSVNLPMKLAKNYDDIKTRMKICDLKEGGKPAITNFKRLEFFENIAEIKAKMGICAENEGKRLNLSKDCDLNGALNEGERLNSKAYDLDGILNGDLNGVLNKGEPAFESPFENACKCFENPAFKCGESLSNGLSLVLAKPLTGRQHQIRLHLFHSTHKILGEPLYGLKKPQIERLLDGKMSEDERLFLTGAKRLCLHSNRLCFEFKGKKFDIVSKRNIVAEFFEALSL